MRRASRLLTLEHLEERCVPATWGNPWPDAQHLTLSFAPDGTQVGTYTSQLFQLLNAQFGGSAAWQREVLRALQTWAVQTNANVSLVPDGGQPFGAPGVIQGDTRFGDLRVAGYPLSATAAALEQPFDAAGGTWSGDLSFNTALNFTPGRAGAFDLFSIALHEAGHAFGLSHSSNPNSPLYEAYRGVRTGLIAEDVSRIQALYGVRQPDRYEGSQGNDSFDRASLLLVVDGVTLLPNESDVTTTNDKDFYKVTVGATVGPATVMLHTNGLSSLQARLTVYDAQRRVIGSVSASDPLNGELAVPLPSSWLNLFGATYYIKVESATSDVFGIGGYQIEVRPNSLLSLGSLLNIVNNVLTVVDYHTNDTLASATGLPQVIAQTDSRFDYVYRASISSASDVDWYLLRAPTPPAGAANVMTVMVWGKQVNGLDPRALVYDALGDSVAANVLVHDDGTYVIQVPSAQANALYYVAVSSYAPDGARSTGTYFLGTDFSTLSTTQRTLVSNRTSPTLTPNLGFTAKQDLLFHFVLTAETAGAPAGSAVEVTVVNSAGQLVAWRRAGAGESQSLNLFLAKGSYTFRFRSVNGNGQAINPLFFSMGGLILSDPVKPYQYDPTSDPSGSPPPSGSEPSASNSSDSAWSSSTW